jgi:transcriptional regulator with XRE-family HTH domain/tetratricopeptide (TPR) repeat protein
VGAGLASGEVAFGQLLRRYRLAAGLTQEELGELAGLSARAVADMERGRTGRPRRRSVDALAEALALAFPQRTLLTQASRSGAACAAELCLDGPGRPTPRQLPAAPPHFAGRAVELDSLTGLLEQAGRTAGAVVISAVAGTAGIGKTGLALHWAHLVADRFADGQLYVNLRGYDPGSPVPATDALAGFLRALDVAGQAMPAEVEERAALYRSLLAERRMLVVLDNARDSAQVRPLLPGAAGCVAIVTSRDSLAGLVARDGARRIELDMLPVQDAVGLLRALVGARVDADPGAAAGLAERCCRLPLALRVAAELAAARPEVPLAELAAELSDEQHRLDLLEAGEDPGTAVRAVLSWSYRHLDAAASRVFRLLAVHPGPDIDAYATAALTAMTLPETGRLLDRLARAHLIQPTTPGRFGMHDLLRRYAADEASRTMTVAEREEARARLMDYLQHTATKAAALAERNCRSGAIMHPEPILHSVPDFVDRSQAMAWLRAERSVLLACLDEVTSDGQQARLVALTVGLGWLLRADDGSDACARAATAAQAARDLGDRLGEAHALLCLGHAQQLTSDPACVATQAQARDIFRDLGDQLGLADALRLLGLRQMMWRDGRAGETLTEARDLYRDLGDQMGLASTLLSLAEIQRLSGNSADAATLVGGALAIFDALGDRVGRASGLLRLGLAQRNTDGYLAAAQSFSEALIVCRELADPGGTADALTLLGEVQCVTGDYSAALQNLTEAYGMSCDRGHKQREARALTSLGVARCATGDPGGASGNLTAALTTYREIGHSLGLTNALRALGDLQVMTGDYATAEGSLAEALAISRDVAAPGFEVEVLNKIGSLRYARGDLRGAMTWHQQALDRARQLAMHLEEGRALAGLARCAQGNGDNSTAVALFRQADAILVRTGAADAHAITSELASLQPAGN